MKLGRIAVAMEMARRKDQFYPDKPWNEIELWGLFLWHSVSDHLKSGILKTDMKKENRTIWVTPSEEFWLNEIKPEFDKLRKLGKKHEFQLLSLYSVPNEVENGS